MLSVLADGTLLYAAIGYLACFIMWHFNNLLPGKSFTMHLFSQTFIIPKAVSVQSTDSLVSADILSMGY